MSFPLQFFWFGVSGVAGFIVDAAVLHSLKGSLGLYGARLVSFVCAVFATWIVNRVITFKTRRSGYSAGKEFFLYVGLMLAGGFVNYAVYAMLIAKYSVVAMYPVWGVAAGSLVGMVINLCTSRFLLFRFTL